MAVHKKYNALGRGLDALISTEGVRPQGSSTINEIPISQIEPISTVFRALRMLTRQVADVSLSVQRLRLSLMILTTRSLLQRFLMA